jgi:ribosomal protein L37AE/L43A
MSAETDRQAECQQCDWKFEKPGDPSGVGIAALVHHRETGHTVGYATNWENSRQIGRQQRERVTGRTEGAGAGGLSCPACQTDLLVSLPNRAIFCRSCGKTYADVTAAGQIRWRPGIRLTTLDSDKE